MKAQHKNGFWFVRFYDCNGYEQETMHTGLHMAMCMAFINRTIGM